jgi:hypothetical protein
MSLSRHPKPGKAARRLNLDRVDIVDASAGRPSPYGHLEPLQRLHVALGDDLDAAVVLVAHVPLNAFALRGVLYEESEPDALHAAFHDVPPPHEHA